MLLPLTVVCAYACAAGASPASANADYVRQPSPLTTPWTNQVSTTNPLPEYPRPQLERSEWQSLNGRWQYERAQARGPSPFGRTLPETILVPFPVESPLSGIERVDTAGWYRRTFRVPPGWGSRHVLLNFGAVSWETHVYVNRRLVGSHRGSYDGFSMDITGALHPNGINELVVGYGDPIGAAGEPVGKQVPGTPSGIYHTASSGIWQTVWLEPVAQAHVTGLTALPDLPHHRVIVSAEETGPGVSRVEASVLAGNRVLVTTLGRPGRPLVLKLPRARLWWPWQPYLYGLRVRLLNRARELDRVTSYFGMRSITLGRVNGVTRLLLNGRFVFQSGALDQGLWPDGLYAAPTDAALRSDIVDAKRLGFNMLREHAKVQPDRWYLWADRLGILVWQDMPNMPVSSTRPPSAAARREFRRELSRIVVQRRSHPSIVTWVPFNEGWQQFDLSGITRTIKQLDPVALVDTQSGSANCCDALESPSSDIRDTHLYVGPFAAPGDRRASAIGEYGGVVPFPPLAHRWPGVLDSVGSPAAIWPDAWILGVLRRQFAMLAQEMRTPGVSAAVFTELADYEQELGIISYDRRVFTVAPALFRAWNAVLTGGSRTGAGVRPQPAAVPAGTTGLWQFDEGRGATAADSSGRHAQLRLSGGARWTRGIRGSAISITTPGAIAQTARPVIDPGHSFSVSAWLSPRRSWQSASAVSEPGTAGSSFSLGLETRPRASQARPGEVSSGVLPAALRTWWTFAVPASPTCPILQCGVQANMHYDDGRLPPRIGSWHNVTGVYDAGSYTVSVFVDGVPEDVEHVGGLPRATGPLTVGSGALVYAPADTFLGAIDELRTYQRALSPSEVWELYAAEQGRHGR
jgi:Concanavalin A-like lectin/glucanases superfamily/Glycosyl hydrolases family 2, sugar binding domain/Glycosyl hydrolases family 2/Glycosyl hydrolases family 2, TIM barrel domain